MSTSDLPPGLPRAEDGEGPARLTLAEEIESARKLATASVMNDDSKEVLALDQDPTGSVVWQSTDLASF